MAKTRYGQRMYRARAARAQEMQAEGAEEYTVNATSGSSILVEDGGQPDRYMVTFLQDGSPMGRGRAQAYSADAIKDEYGVDIMKGKLINGVSTEAYSQAISLLKSASTSNSIQNDVKNYLMGDESISDFDRFEIVDISRAVNSTYSAMSPRGTAEGASVLNDIVSEWRKLNS